jgi:DNA-directed RNA polymerase
MNVVLRDAFIRIHQEDVIGRLKSEFEARYRGAIYRARVLANTPVGERISQLRKEHPRGVIEELLIEHKRQKLLASSDPAKRKEGQKMVTPASIFEEFGKKSDVQNVVQPEDLEEAGDEDGSAAAADAGEGETAAAAAPKRRTTKKKAKAGPTFDHPLPLTPDSGDDVMPASRRVNPEHEAEAYTNAIKELSTKNFFSNHLNRAERVQERMGRSKSATLGTIELWLPLTFPDIPKKGEFDVRKLRESQYFFS